MRKGNKMDSYYINLVRLEINKAINALIQAQNYIIKAKLPKYQYNSIERVISILQNRLKEMGRDLRC